MFWNEPMQMLVIPAKAGIASGWALPAFAGMTAV